MAAGAIEDVGTEGIPRYRTSSTGSNGDAIPDDNSANYEVTAAVASFFAASRKLDSWEKAKAQGALESMGGHIVEEPMKHWPEPTVGASFFDHSVKKFTAESKEYRGWYSEVIVGDPPALGV